MDASYDTIYELCNTFFTNELSLSELMIVLKILAIAFFLINIYTNMFSKVRVSMGNAQLPFDQQKLFSSLFIVLIIIFYDRLLIFLDTLLLGLDSFYSHLSPLTFAPKEEEITDSPSFDTNSLLKLASAKFISILEDPSYIFILLLKGIAWIIDIAIYIVFLIERFFFIGLLKILGAVAIVLAVFEKFRDYFYKWLKLYIAVYLLIFPFFLIIGLSSFIYEYLDKSITEQIPNKAVQLLVGDEIRVVVLVVMIWLKLRLFKKSHDIVYKLFV
ncbi:MAG: hypothetical protein GYB37_14415 [Algicola sp.]|nr:hypothetical protein [Algicola sp.]